MKKIISTLFLVLLILSVAGTAWADESDGYHVEEDPNLGTVYVLEMPEVGLSLCIPESFITDSIGHCDIMVSDEMGYGSGVWYTEFGYNAMSYDDFQNYGFDEDCYSRLLGIVCMKNGCDMSALQDKGIDFNWNDAFKIADLGTYTHYALIGPEDSDTFAGFQDEYGNTNEFGDEYFSMLERMGDVVYASSYSEPKNIYEDRVGVKLEFETTDLYGNPVSSSDLFSQNEVTMVNCWATWCGFCVGELPDLQQIDGRLKARGCGVVGFLTDGEDPDDLEDAIRDVQEAGVTYPVVLAPKNLDDYFDFSKGMPATYFVNRNGEIVGTPIFGAQVDKYEQAISDILDASAA